VQSVKPLKETGTRDYNWLNMGSLLSQAYPILPIKPSSNLVSQSLQALKIHGKSQGTVEYIGRENCLRFSWSQLGLLPAVEKRLPHWWQRTRPGTLRTGAAGGGLEAATGGAVDGAGELTSDLRKGVDLFLYYAFIINFSSVFSFSIHI
jgi:hypothetical protein